MFSAPAPLPSSRPARPEIQSYSSNTLNVNNGHPQNIFLKMMEAAISMLELLDKTDFNNKHNEIGEILEGYTKLLHHAFSVEPESIAQTAFYKDL